MAALVGACTHSVTQPREVPAPPTLGVAYTGRIVLRSPVLRDHVDEFNDAWTVRLGILGATSNITYDHDRAVLDVYGLAPGQLPRVAEILSVLGEGYTIDGVVFGEASAFEWTKPDPLCNCSGRVRVALFSAGVMCELGNGEHVVGRGAWSVSVRTVRYWMEAGSTRYFDHPPGQTCMSSNPYWAPHHLLVDLPAGASADEDQKIVLALGGRRLPAVPEIAEVTPAGAVTP